MSTVIKAGQSSKLRHRLSVVDLADHLREASQLVEEARQRAADILAAAEEESRQIRAKARSEMHQAGYDEGREQGYHQGYEEGGAAGRKEAFEQGRHKFQEEQTHLVDDLKRVVDQINGMKDAVRADAERNVLHFAIKIASKLTHALSQLSSAPAQANLVRALDLVHERTGLTVALHSDDLKAIEELAPAAAEQVMGGRDVQFTADDGIARGGCIVRTTRTEVDATLDAQIAEIVSVLLGGGPAAPAKESTAA